MFFNSLPLKVAKNNKKRTERQSLFNSHRQSRWINSDLRVTSEWLRQLDGKRAKQKCRGLYEEVHQHEQQQKVFENKERDSKRQKHTLNSPKTAAAKFNTLLPQEKADIICDIAEASLKELLETPAKGLADSEASLNNIIKRRKWLEKTDDVVARLLAIRLQEQVDRAIYDAFVHSEKQALGFEPKVGYKLGMLSDKSLIKRILKANEINENEYLNFALSLDTEVANLCRERNYKGKDFLTGKVLDEIPDELNCHIAGSYTWIGVSEDFDSKVKFSEIDANMLWELLNYNSVQNISEVILPLTLNAIDESKCMCLMAEVFSKHGKLLVEEQVRQAQVLAKDNKPHDAWKWLYQNMNSETEGADQARLNRIESKYTRNKLASYARDIYYKNIFKPSDGAELKYGGIPQMNLCFFIRDISLLTERGLFGSKKLILKGLVGYWLKIYEN